MEEIPGSRYSSSRIEKGLDTPQERTTGAIHLPTDNDGEQELPPMDRGMDAWLFLAACFVMEALVWGFAFSYGVFQKYYSGIDAFKNSGNIAVVGTCAMVRLLNLKYITFTPNRKIRQANPVYLLRV